MIPVFDLNNAQKTLINFHACFIMIGLNIFWLTDEWHQMDIIAALFSRNTRRKQKRGVTNTAINKQLQNID